MTSHMLFVVAFVAVVVIVNVIVVTIRTCYCRRDLLFMTMRVAMLMTVRLLVLLLSSSSLLLLVPRPEH